MDVYGKLRWFYRQSTYDLARDTGRLATLGPILLPSSINPTTITPTSPAANHLSGSDIVNPAVEAAVLPNTVYDEINSLLLSNEPRKEHDHGNLLSKNNATPTASS